MTLAQSSTLGASLPPSVAANPKYWLKDIAIWPSGYLPCPDGANSKPQLFTNFAQQSILPIVRNVNIVFPVALLLYACRPPNVARLVVTVFIGIAINGMIQRWANPHIAKECSEGCCPFFTDGHPAPAVVFPRNMALVTAPCSDVVPNRVLGFFGKTMRPRLTLKLLHEASARSCIAVSQKCQCYILDSSALAFTFKPAFGESSAIDLSDYRESREYRPWWNYYKFRHYLPSLSGRLVRWPVSFTAKRAALIIGQKCR